MSRALFLKRHLQIKTLDQPPSSAAEQSTNEYDDADYCPPAKVAAVFNPAYRHDDPSSFVPRTDSAPLDLSLKSNTPITPPPSPASCDNADVSATTKLPAKTNINDKLSPVSGTVILYRSELEADPSVHLVSQRGDIDPLYNVVEVTDEAKVELAKIDNKIGDYVCKLCRETYVDAFGLAQHRCSCIVHVEYRCSECEKVFNCPANLASHRRWHRPKCAVSDMCDSDVGNESSPRCPVCGETFRRQSYLRKHLSKHRIVELQLNLDFKSTSMPSSAFTFHRMQATN